MAHSVLDPNKELICPYDSNHRIRATSWQIHLVKCKKSNPEIASQFDQCPFSASHVIRKTEMKDHIIICPKRLASEDSDLKKTQTKLSGNCNLPLYAIQQSANLCKNDVVIKEDDYEDWDEDFKQIKPTSLHSSKASLDTASKVSLNDTVKSEPREIESETSNSIISNKESDKSSIQPKISFGRGQFIAKNPAPKRMKNYDSDDNESHCTNTTIDRFLDAEDD